MSRIVCRFSCGAASAVATKLILARYPAEQVVIFNAFIAEEHPDNRRFLVDCERWFAHSVTGNTGRPVRMPYRPKLMSLMYAQIVLISGLLAVLWLGLQPDFEFLDVIPDENGRAVEQAGEGGDPNVGQNVAADFHLSLRSFSVFIVFGSS